MASSSAPASAAGTGDSEMPDLRRTLLTSVGVTWLIMLLGIGIPLSLAMNSWVSGMAVALFTSLFGGPGFGLMAGMALHTAHMEKWEKLHPELAAAI